MTIVLGDICSWAELQRFIYTYDFRLRFFANYELALASENAPVSGEFSKGHEQQITPKTHSEIGRVNEP